MQKSLQEYEELLAQAQSPTEKLELLREINFLRQHIIDNKTTQYIRLTMRLAKAEDDKHYQTHALRLYSYHLLNRGELQKAKANTLKLASLLKETNNRHDDADVYRLLGLISERMGEFTDALHYYYIAMRRAEEVEDNLLLLPVCINLGLFFFGRLQDDIKAIEYFTRARKLARATQRWSAYATSCNYLAISNFSVDNITQGKKYLDEGIRIATRYNLSLLLLYLKDTLAQYYKRIGNHKTTVRILEEIHKEFERTSNLTNLQSGYLSLAHSYISLKEWRKAEQALRRYESIHKKTSLERDMDSLLSVKSELAKQKKEYPKAIKYLEQKIEIQAKNYRKDWQQKMDILEQSYKMESYKKDKEFAESVAKMRMDFLSNMSHEIRSPMNAVLGLTNILLRKNEANDNTTQLRTIKITAEHLLHVVNDILDLNKIDAGKLSIERTSVSLLDVASTVVQSLALKANEKNLSLSYHIDSDVPSIVIADSARISQILINLVNNALTFTEQGGVELRIRCQGKARGRNIKLLLSVHDSGIGMSKEQSKNLFLPFKQAESGSYRKYGGTGLGLHISKQLAELMGGSISVESKKGKGSVFTLLLPVQRSSSTTHQQTNPANAHTLTAEKQEYSLLSKKTYLLVDDNDIDLDILKETLKAYIGEEVKTLQAKNGKEALGLLELYNKQSQDKAIDCILSDLNMPQMNGFELAKEVQKNFPHTPCIAVTSALVPLSSEELLREGFRALVHKPYKAEQLLETICKVLIA